MVGDHMGILCAVVFLFFLFFFIFFYFFIFFICTGLVWSGLVWCCTLYAVSIPVGRQSVGRWDEIVVATP
jgi:hypothetical protein